MVDPLEATYRPGFVPALHSLARVFGGYRKAAGTWPTLVGSAAASLYTAGAVTSSDLDVVAADEALWSRLIGDHGWRPEDRPGRRAVGWLHPDIPEIGVRLAGGPSLATQPERVRLQLLPVGTDGFLQLLPLEDLIADRLARYADSVNRSAETMLEQAILLLRTAEDPDVPYLLHRIVERGGDPSLLGLE